MIILLARNAFPTQYHSNNFEKRVKINYVILFRTPSTQLILARIEQIPETECFVFHRLCYQIVEVSKLVQRHSVVLMTFFLNTSKKNSSFNPSTLIG